MLTRDQAGFASRLDRPGRGYPIDAHGRQLVLHRCACNARTQAPQHEIEVHGVLQIPAEQPEGLVDAAFHEHRRMEDARQALAHANLEAWVDRAHEGLAVAAEELAAAMGKSHVRGFQGLYRQADGLRVIDVIRIQDADDPAVGQCEALVEGVADAVVLLAHQIGQAHRLAAQHLESPVGRSAVDDDVLDIREGLRQDRIDRALDRRPAIVHDRDDAHQTRGRRRS